MSDKTKIEWADATANFWIGCTKVSAACDHCYAEADWDKRKHRVTWGPHGGRSKCAAGAAVVRKMQRGAADFIAIHGRKPGIFVNSLSDWADNHKSILPEWRAEIFQLARECPDVILMLLTKRSQNITKMLPDDWANGYPNVWLGTTVENQEEADRRIPHLLATPAAVHFLSCEPLLGPVDLTQIPCGKFGQDDIVDSALAHPAYRQFAGINWVIVGGESGPKARPMHPDWAPSLRDQCAAAGVAFHFKQWGEWVPYKAVVGGDLGREVRAGRVITVNPSARTIYEQSELTGRGGEPGCLYMERIGKKSAGRVLDGVEHSEFPA